MLCMHMEKYPCTLSLMLTHTYIHTCMTVSYVNHLLSISWSFLLSLEKPDLCQPYFFFPGDVQNVQAADTTGTQVLGVGGTDCQNLGTYMSAVRLPQWLMGEESACNAGDPRQVQSLGQEDHLEEGMATHPSVLAWRIPWTEELGRLGPTGWQKLSTYIHMCSQECFLWDSFPRPQGRVVQTAQ